MRYQQHLVDAARYATLALTLDPPDADQLERIAPLRDDVAQNLTQLVVLLCGHQPHPVAVTALREVVNNPARALTFALATADRLSPDWEQRPAPTDRYAGRPAHPWATTTALGGWQGLGAETMFAAHELSPVLPDVPGPDRWDAVHDVAALVQAFAALEGDLASQDLTAPSRIRLVTRQASGALALQARELAHHAAGPGDPTTGAYLAGQHPAGHALAPAAGGGLGVVLVSRVAALPAATARLERQLRAAGPRATAQELMGASIALAKTSLAASRALDAAATAPGCALPELLRENAAVLTAYSEHLQAAVRVYAPRLGTLHPGTAALHAQAGQIGGEGARRVIDLVARPAAAEAASPDLIDFAARLGPATGALHAAADAAHTSGRLYLRDRSPDATRGWAPSRDLGHLPLLDTLDAARRVAARIPAPPAGCAPTPAPVSRAAVADLLDVLQARHVAIRPRKPSTPAWRLQADAPTR